MSTTAPAPTMNKSLLEWVEEWTAILTPDDVEWCDGSDAQYKEQCRRLVGSGTFIPLNPELRPDSFLCRSDPGDVARVEDRTFICCEKPEDAGPTNNWIDPEVMRAELLDLYRGAMQRSDPLCDPVLHGTARQSYRPHRRAVDRLGLRRRLDAHHDPHGKRSTRRPGRDR